MGDVYAIALSKGIGYINPEYVNMADNRLSSTGSHAIITSLKPSIKNLNLSHNKIDSTGAIALGEFIKTKASFLRILNLENTKLGDSSTAMLCKYLVDHPKMSELNLAKNQLTDVSCDAIAHLVYDTFYLSTLILHWNLITGEGATKILKATARYYNIKVLDLSWNSIGTFKSKVFANQLAEVLTGQENLLHLDISHNNLKDEECRTVACALSTNHTLWGMHFVGNSTYALDSKGFLRESGSSIGVEHLEIRINGASMVVSNTEQEEAKLKRTHNCWICEGWNEAMFEYPQAKPNEPVYLLLESDDFKGDLMYTETGITGCILWRMCPPGKARFFFITEGKAVVSPKHPRVKCEFRRKVGLL